MVCLAWIPAPTCVNSRCHPGPAPCQNSFNGMKRRMLAPRILLFVLLHLRLSFPGTTIDFRACRRTCATHLSQYGGVKDVQAHLRHSRATTTLEVYIREIPEAVRPAVEDLDAALTVDLLLVRSEHSFHTVSLLLAITTTWGICFRSADNL
jgi:hypothetical protein